MALLDRVSRNDTYAGHTTLEVEVCAVCGVLFAAPQRLIEHCRQTGDSFFCPNGDSLIFNNFENARLKRELARVKDRLASEQARADQTEASLRATKGVVTRQRKKLEKVVAGVCPVDGCKRHFRDLRRHIATKHPGYDGGSQ
jgi:hypothetical protein